MADEVTESDERILASVMGKFANKNKEAGKFAGS